MNKYRLIVMGVCFLTAGAVSSSADEVVPIAACRLLDTRPGDPIAANTALSVDVRGECLVPETATGVVYNLTVVSPAGIGFAKVYGTNLAPDTAVVTYNAGETVVTTGALSWLSVDDETTSAYDPPSWGLRVLSSQATDVVIDLTGYLTRLSTTTFKGTVTDTESGLGPPWFALEIDSLPPSISLICQMPWIDPEECEVYEETDTVCGVGHVGRLGPGTELFVHSMAPCT